MFQSEQQCVGAEANTMKKEVGGSFEYWFNFYKIENDKRVQMLAMLDEVFAVFEDSTKEEIQGQWKVLRKPKSNEFSNE